MNKNLLSLRQDINRCTICPKAITAVKNFPFKNTMKWLPKDTKVMFVAQDPPASGKYLYDGTNEKFTKGVLKLFKEAGLFHSLKLNDFVAAGFYLTDILKCPGGKIETCKAFLRREIHLLAPKVICTMGKKALKAFLKSKQFSLKEYVGQFVPSLQLDQELAQGKPVFCCYFPIKYPVKDKVKIKHLTRLAAYLRDHDL